jgi:hypothetical protein
MQDSDATQTEWLTSRSSQTRHLDDTVLFFLVLRCANSMAHNLLNDLYVSTSLGNPKPDLIMKVAYIW